MTSEQAALRARVEAQPLWYHTLDLGEGIVTPGWFDLRPVVDTLPWPDVAGKRCLDVGTWDGFFAFELERRGALEVVAVDIPSNAEWDHLPRERKAAVAQQEALFGHKGEGFTIAAEALGSKVTREWVSIYDLSPERLGTFDVVVCGSLMLHLRDPYRALEAVRSVCSGFFLSSEAIDAGLTLRARNRACLFLEGTQGRWMTANAAGHARMLEISGFDVVRRSHPYSVRFGVGHPDERMSPRQQAEKLMKKVVTRGQPDGVLHAAALARPGL